MNNDLCIVLTARMGSTRLPGKAMADVAGKPLLYWIARRLQALGNVVITCTPGVEDEPLVALAKAMAIPVHVAPTGDVVTAMDTSYKTYFPACKYLLRGLGDLPFMASELVDRALVVMRKYKADSFAWALSPSVFPVYGSREFPYAIDAWHLINQRSRTRQHVDAYFHENRGIFNTILHEPPESAYFRDVRLEVDYPEDLALVRAIAANVSMLAPVKQILAFLDSHDEVAQLNHSCVEITGPSVYSYKTKRSWQKSMMGKSIVGWNDYVWTTPSGKGQPVFCKAGTCLLGVAENGILFAKAGRIKGNAFLDCPCHSGLIWR